MPFVPQARNVWRHELRHASARIACSVHRQDCAERVRDAHDFDEAPSVPGHRRSDRRRACRLRKRRDGGDRVGLWQQPDVRHIVGRRAHPQAEGADRLLAPNRPRHAGEPERAADTAGAARRHQPRLAARCQRATTARVPWPACRTRRSAARSIQRVVGARAVRAPATAGRRTLSQRPPMPISRTIRSASARTSPAGRARRSTSAASRTLETVRHRRPAAISPTRPLTFTAPATATTAEGEVIARQAVTGDAEEDGAQALPALLIRFLHAAANDIVMPARLPLGGHWSM